MERLPELITERLKLSKVNQTDIPAIVRYAGNKVIADHTLNIPHPYTADDAIFWLNLMNQGFKEKDGYSFGIRDKSTDAFIGAVGLKVNRRFNRAELGYWLAEPFWNKGYVTEAVAAVLRFGFEALDLNKIYAIHLTENPASGKVMIKNGMIKEGEMKAHIKKGDTYRSVIQYGLTKDDYQSQL